MLFIAQSSRFMRSFFASFLIIALSSSAAFAAAAEDAQTSLKHSLDAVFQTLNDPQFKDEAGRDKQLDHIEQIVKSVFDYNEFSARTVGKQWHQFSPNQQAHFTEAFADLLRATYIERVRDYSGNGVTYLGQRASTKGDKIEVQTHLDYKGKTVPVDYRMLLKDRWVIYDVIVEGVSLVKNYRTQFQELLNDNNSPDDLIARVKLRAEEVRKQAVKTQ